MSEGKYVICPQPNGDGLEVDKEFYEFFDMLNGLQTLAVSLDTLSDTDQRVIESAILKFKFKEDIALPMQQLLKNQIYYDSGAIWNVSFLRFTNFKNTESDYDFTIEVNLKHFKRIIYQGVSFLPATPSNQVIPPNVSIH